MLHLWNRIRWRQLKSSEHLANLPRGHNNKSCYCHVIQTLLSNVAIYLYSLSKSFLPSPSPESGRRQVMSCMERLEVPTFSNLDGTPHPSQPPTLRQKDGVEPLVYALSPLTILHKFSNAPLLCHLTSYIWHLTSRTAPSWTTNGLQWVLLNYGMLILFNALCFNLVLSFITEINSLQKDCVHKKLSSNWQTA